MAPGLGIRLGIGSGNQTWYRVWESDLAASECSCHHVQVRRHCLSQVDIIGQNLADYFYKDVEYLAKVSTRPRAPAEGPSPILMETIQQCVSCGCLVQVADHPGAFVLSVGGFGRLVSCLLSWQACDCLLWQCCHSHSCHSHSIEAESCDLHVTVYYGSVVTVTHVTVTQ